VHPYCSASRWIPSSSQLKILLWFVADFNAKHWKAGTCVPRIGKMRPYLWTSTARARWNRSML
jgi:hypothetical protein